MRYGDHRSGYPIAPGSKGSAETSRAAADDIAPKAISIRQRVFEALKLQPMSPEQICEHIGEPIWNVRPRLSEIAAQGLIEDSGKRHLSASSKAVIIWRIKP